jgi:hypothetical protein
MYLQKVISRKIFKKELVFVGLLKVNDKNRRIQDPNQDSLVRGMDPRIRIHTKCHGSATLVDSIFGLRLRVGYRIKSVFNHK